MKKIDFGRIKETSLILLPLAIAVIILASFVDYTFGIEKQTLVNYISFLEPRFLFVIFGLILIFFGLNFKGIRKLFGKVKLKTWMFLIIIVLIAFSLRMFVAPHTHRVYFDEDIYLDIGKEVLSRGTGSLCNYGTSTSCLEYDLMKWPSGYPFLLTIPYSIFGIGENVAMDFTVFIGSLTIVLIFFIGYLLSDNERIGLYAALLFALTPIHIMWSGTTAAEPYLVFFTVLAVFTFIMSFRVKSWMMGALALSSLAYALQLKSEGLMLLVLFPIMIYLLDKKWMEKLKNKKFLSMWFVFLLLITPFLVHMNFAFRTDTWGSSGNKFDLEIAKKNIPENAEFWIKGYPTIDHPILYTIFAVLGLIFLIKKDVRLGLFLFIWFGLFFILYGSFYAGSVKYGSDVRYALSGYPSLVLLAAFGMYFIEKKLSKFVRFMPLILAAIVFVSFYFYVPSIATPAGSIEEAQEARAYHDFVVREAQKLPNNCYILSHDPSIYLVMGKNALQTWNGQNRNLMDGLFKKTDCIVFDNGFWCNLEPDKSALCKYIFDNYKLSEINSVTDKYKIRTYSLFRVFK